MTMAKSIYYIHVYNNEFKSKNDITEIKILCVTHVYYFCFKGSSSTSLNSNRVTIFSATTTSDVATLTSTKGNCN